jgi:TRAP transporter 4TM/12TM fusion protein
VAGEDAPQLRFRRHAGLLGLVERVLLVCIPINGILTILDVFLYFGKSVWVQQYLAVFLGLIVTLVPLLAPATKTGFRDRLPWYDAVLSVLGFAVGLYVVLFYQDIVASSGLMPLDRTIMGTIAILLVLESCRRLLGWSLVVIIVLFILYGHYSYLLPEPLYSRGVPWIRLANYLYLDPGALFGLPLRIVGTTVLSFIFFGRMFFSTGGGTFLSDGAMSIMGRFRGGAAKASVLASSAFGTISGSPTANVVTTGFFTIPLMKKTGFTPHFAGAVEATASTGGQIIPPVMGVTAFLMAELLSMPYAQVALAALIPGVIYYIGVFIQVDLEAAKMNLKGIPGEALPSFKKVLLANWMFLIPIAVLIYCLFISLIDPDMAGLYTVAATLIIAMFRRGSRIKLTTLLKILEGTGESLLEIGIIVAAAGLILGVMAVSGLGFSFSLALTQMAGDNFLLLLLLAALGAIVLGMGMPVLPAYVLVVLLVAPALIKAGMIPIVAHMFVFYFAVLSFLTPPICLAVYTAASLANSSPMKTALQALRLGIAAYIFPFVFAFSPALLCVGPLGKVLSAAFLAVLGIIVLSIGFEGYLLRRLHWVERILSILGGIGLMSPSWAGRGLGVALAAVALFFHFEKGRIQSPSRRRGKDLEAVDHR